MIILNICPTCNYKYVREQDMLKCKHRQPNKMKRSENNRKQYQLKKNGINRTTV